MLRALVSITPEIAIVFNRDRRPVFINPAFSGLWEDGTFQVNDVIQVVHPDNRHSFRQAIRAASRRHRASVAVEASLGRPDAWRKMSGRVTNMFDDPAVAGMVLHARNISEKPLPDTAGESPASIGEPVALADRAEVMNCLDKYVHVKQRVSLLVCDLDNFSLINDSLGHSAGDDVLAEITSRLVGGVHEGDTIGRLGADEFAIVCPHTADDSLAALLTSLDLIFHDPLVVGANDYVVTASIGFATLLECGGTLETLAAADAAMHLAKDRGRDRLEVFDEGLRDAAMATLRRTSELRHAAANDELELCYQPIVELATGRMAGCEALLRWNHPWEGQLTAASFIGIAESSGLVNSLTEALLGLACKAAYDLSSSGDTRFVAVNLSPRQLTDPRLVSLVESALSDVGVEADRLTIEITETAVLSDLDATLGTLRRLRDLGVEVALDDFGTGYSSLTHLKRLPVNKLKIDKSFVGGVTRNSDDLSIVASVAHLARTLGLTCIAEGIETNEQSHILEDLGCKLAQGYLWSPAVPLEELKKMTGKRAFNRPGRLADPSVDATLQARVLELHRAGTSLETIAGLLNDDGSRTARGTRWRSSSVARIIARSPFSQFGHGEVSRRPDPAGLS